MQLLCLQRRRKQRRSMRKKRLAMTSTPLTGELMRSEGDVNLSALRDAWRQHHLSAATQAALDDDAGVFLHQSLSTPCLNALQGCDGAFLHDLDGRRILDFHGNAVHQVGYRNRRVLDAVIAQLETLPFCPRRYANLPATTLARLLTELAPGDLNRVLFAPGGALAVGMALKLARAATGRHGVISLWDSFHGASLDAISVGGEAVFRQDAGPLLPGVEHVPPPDPLRNPLGPNSPEISAALIEYVLEKQGDIGAVIAETVRATPYVPPPDYWPRVRAACDKHGALLILDEIPTGLGRTGELFAHQHFGIVPDMVIVGKGLGGGVFPLAALIAREGLNAAAPHRALGHYTHEKNPVACAAGIATLQCLLEDGLLENARLRGEQAVTRLRAMQAHHPCIGEVRALGLLMGVVIRNPITGLPDDDLAERILYAALERGLSFKITMGCVLTLMPPLCITAQEMDMALDALEQAISAL